MFLEISQNSQENICARVSFLIKLQASGRLDHCFSNFRNIIAILQNSPKETLAQVFSCEFWQTSKNTFYYRTPLDDCFCKYFIKLPLLYKIIAKDNTFSKKQQISSFNLLLVGLDFTVFFICVFTACFYSFAIMKLQINNISFALTSDLASHQIMWHNGLNIAFCCYFFGFLGN